MCRASGRCPSTAAVYEALTSRACEEEFSYERMETMGDAVRQNHVTCTLGLRFRV